uniref:heme-binding protein 1 isoform X1 n=1 Tax=Podarcis muralis TaxID=64176 RepID=UPI0010A0B333|nr:heme-binding protein 1 isoform X1 [Podarcis muralis]
MFGNPTRSWQKLNNEEKEYEGGKFATIEHTGETFDAACLEAVAKLYKYFEGSNDQGAKMSVVDPVCITALPADDGSLQLKVKVSLQIPSQFQASPPSPADKSIRIEQRGKMAVFFMTFHGNAKGENYKNYAAQLRSAVGTEKADHKELYIFSSYDPQNKSFWNCHEVSLWKK